MSLSAKIRRAPLRAVTGAYILNSGVGKLSTDDDTAKRLHGMASGTYGFLDNVQPRMFAKALGVGEIAVGSVLLLPIAPPVVAGAALLGFSGALLNMYWRTPGLHQEGNPRPTVAGTPLAKDVWMFGIGTGLIADAILEPAHDKRLEVGATVAEKRKATSRRAKRKAAKAAAAATRVGTERSAQGKAMLAEARGHLAEAQEHAAKRAERAAKHAKRTTKRAQKASDAAGKRLAEMRGDYASAAGEKAAQARHATQHAAARAQEVASHAQDAAARVKERVAS